MSRSGYSDNCDNLGLWRGAVDSAIHGKRGQAFLLELAAAMDAMPEKKLVTGELVDKDGCCCTLGVVCKARGIDKLPEAYDPDAVGRSLGIARAMAAEIAYENDEHFTGWGAPAETPEQRWTRMRTWVSKKLRANQLADIEAMKP